jgi:hypothetical protein
MNPKASSYSEFCKILSLMSSLVFMSNVSLKYGWAENYAKKTSDITISSVLPLSAA